MMRVKSNFTVFLNLQLWMKFCGQGGIAFCSGGDQSFRGKEGYADFDSFGRLNVLDLQVQIRRLPKPVIAMVISINL